MPRYNVMIKRTRTIESSAEIEISAKDEEAAQERAEKQIQAAFINGDIDERFNWEETSTDDEFEYEASQ